MSNLEKSERVKMIYRNKPSSRNATKALKRHFNHVKCHKTRILYIVIHGKRRKCKQEYK